MTSGIYAITNMVAGKRYIGSATDIKRRWDSHKYYLRRNRHHSKKLQNAWNKYGESNFVLFVLYECLPIKENMIFFEQLWIDFEGCENLYNILPTAGSPLGTKCSDETKKKLQDARRCRSVLQINLSGEILGKYKSIKEAERQTGISIGKIHKSLVRHHMIGDTLFVENEHEIWSVVREKIRKRIKKNTQLPVYQIDIHTRRVIKLWETMNDAATYLDINPLKIYNAAFSKRHVSVGGYYWRVK